MTPADEAVLDLLQKAVGDDIEPWMLDVVKAQVSENGIDGLTPTAYAVVESIVRKHGDPSRPGYAAMHPNGGHTGIGAQSSTTARLKAGRAQLRGGDPVTFTSLTGRQKGTYVQRNGNGTHTIRTAGGGSQKVKDAHLAPDHLAHMLPDRAPTTMLGTLY